MTTRMTKTFTRRSGGLMMLVLLAIIWSSGFPFDMTSAHLLLGLPSASSFGQERGGSTVVSGRREEISASQEYERGVLILKLKPSAAEPLIANLRQGKREVGKLALSDSLQALNQKYLASGIEPLFDPESVSPERLARVRARFPQRSQRAAGDNPLPRLDHIFLLHLDSQTDIERAAREYAANDDVEYAEPNGIAKAHFYPNDTYFNANDLWGMFNVNAPAAWDEAQGQGVTVAVIDTGVDLGHPDLSPNIWVNGGETPNNNIDDDSNSYVDDVNGWDFPYNDKNPNDAFGHGTHVAGTVAAVGNNSLGVVGLAYKSRIMAVKGLPDGGSGPTGNLAKAIVYAAMNGADVINNSWGGGAKYTANQQLVEDAVNLAHAYGVVIVSSAGNDYQADVMGKYPANVKKSLAVSAFKRNNTISSYSNIGHKIDVAAPGGQGGNTPPSLTPGNDILSTTPQSSALANYGYPTVNDGNGNKWMSLAGTSMAAPHVSALAALLIQVHPAWTNEAIRQAIRQTATDVSNPGFDKESGYGLINAAKAVSPVTFGSKAPPSALITEPRNYQLLNGTAKVDGFAAGFGSTYYEVLIGAGEFPTLWSAALFGNSPINDGTLGTFDTADFPDGVYTLRLRVFDAYGRVSEDRVVATINNIFIASPAGQQILYPGSFNVTGMVRGDYGFQSYKLEWAPGCNASSGFTTIATGTSQVISIGSLGNWNLTPVPDGEITLQLTATFSNAPYTVTEKICVIVDKLIAPGWPVAVNHLPTAKSPKIADLDKDGKNEIVYGGSVFQSDGTVRTGWTNFPGLGRSNPAILDLDGKPDFEIVAAVYDGQTSSPNQGAPVIYAYRHDKTVLWSYPVQNPKSNGYNHGEPSSISAADFDRDGQMEIVFTMYYQINPNAETHVYVLNATNGALEQNFTIPGMTYSSVALADINDDCAPDLVIVTHKSNYKDGLVSVVKFDGTPLPGWPKMVSDTTATEDWEFIDPVVADPDLDYRYEILVGKYLWNHDGTLVAGWPITKKATTTGVIVPLPDGDAQWEVITSGGHNTVFSVHEHHGALKFERMSFDTFRDLTSYRRGNPIVADLDGDGQVEIVRPPEGSSSSASKPGRLHGTEALSATNVSGFPRYVMSPDPGGWASPIRSTAAVGDVDKDGKADLVVAAGGQIYLWRLNKTFNPSLSYWPMFQHDLFNTGVMPIYNSVGSNNCPPAY